MKKNARISLTPTLKRFKYILDVFKSLTDNYIFIIDLKTNTALVSSNLVSDFNLPSEVFQNITDYWFPLIHQEEQPTYIMNFENTMLNHNPTEFISENRIKNRKDKYIWIKTRARLGYDNENKPIIFAGIMSPMSMRNSVDEVTGLLNKYQFENEVKRALLLYRESGIDGALFMFGLDNFKNINEAHNRVIGDILLKNVADKTLNVLPMNVKLFKLDGDTFAVVLPNVNEEYIEELFANVQKALLTPQTINGKNFFATISSGTVFYPQAGKDYLVLHKHLEAAMSMAKREGKNRNVIFTKEHYNRWIRSLYMREYLQKSVDNNCMDFELYYQPQVSSKTQKLIGAEALLRWHNPRGKMSAPMEFIPILEETHLILPVGRWIFEEATKQLKQWQKIIPNFNMSINISYEQIRDLSFKEFVFEILKKYKVQPSTIILEMTESKIVSDWSFVNRQFEEFRRHGIKMAIDDFGTGNSSLASMKYMNCDIVKIDRAFVEKILESEFDFKLVDQVIKLCHSVGIITVVEGVERTEEYEVLKNQCDTDVIQGYLFGHPEPPKIFEKKFLNNEYPPLINFPSQSKL